MKKVAKKFGNVFYKHYICIVKRFKDMWKVEIVQGGESKMIEFLNENKIKPEDIYKIESVSPREIKIIYYDRRGKTNR